jgi:hypothetical protein
MTSSSETLLPNLTETGEDLVEWYFAIVEYLARHYSTVGKALARKLHPDFETDVDFTFTKTVMETARGAAIEEMHYRQLALQTSEIAPSTTTNAPLQREQFSQALAKSSSSLCRTLQKRKQPRSHTITSG